MVRKNKIPMATASRGRRRSELTRHVGIFLSLKESEREISAEKDAVGTTVKEKTTTWNKSCTESTNRETGELYKMVEAAVMDEKLEQKRKRNDQGSAGAASKEKGRGGRSKELDRRDATQPPRCPEQKLRSGTGSWTLFSGNTSKLLTNNEGRPQLIMTKALADDAEQRHEQLKLGQRPR